MFVDVPHPKPKNGHDYADRLSFRYSFVIFLSCAILTASQLFLGDPITCWVPKHFSGDHGHETYANNYCLVANTYYASFEQTVPQQYEDDRRHVVRYYQWIPMMLALQALLFYIPIMIWKEFSTKSGLSMKYLVEIFLKFDNMDECQKNEENVTKMSLYVKRYLDECKKQRRRQLFASPCSRQNGTFLYSRYLIVKLLFLANIIGQFILLSNFLDCNFFTFGIELLQSFTNGNEWDGFRRFPRVTMCDLQVRRLANVHRYTVQCVLTINLFVEKIYLILWFWLIYVLIMTIWSTIKWFALILPITHRNYISGFIKKNSKADSKDMRLFINSHLRHDGVFILKMIEESTSALVVSELLRHLYKSYQESVNRLILLHEELSEISTEKSSNSDKRSSAAFSNEFSTSSSDNQQHNYENASTLLVRPLPSTSAIDNEKSVLPTAPPPEHV